MEKSGQAGEAGFQSRKSACLSKRDKSSAGRIDPKAVEICAAINAREEYYTLSSCAGRCFLYIGDGIKSHHHFASSSTVDDYTDTYSSNAENSPSGLGFFKRYRVCHDIVRDENRYFNLSTLHSDPTGGGDPERSIGQYDYKSEDVDSQILSDIDKNECNHDDNKIQGPIWLRFEPFILHVMCRSLAAASALMTAARPSFKNVGLTSFKDGFGRYIVAIWGDEGLDMPLTTPNDVTNFIYNGNEAWLRSLINERHARNWNKINRFVDSVRLMPPTVDDIDNAWIENSTSENSNEESLPKRFDIVGDVALLQSIPPKFDSDQDREEVGRSIMSRNKAIKVVAVRSSSLSGTERSPGNDGLIIIAGAKREPLVTSHTEYGIKCVVDLNQTFFSARMAAERLRICHQVARGEKVLALFCGVGMDALQIVARTESTVVGVELNPVAFSCALRGKQLLVRNKAVKCPNAHDRIEFINGDAIEVMKSLEPKSYERILAPRPKEGTLDGDLGTGDCGGPFLLALLPLLKNQGECHWYDFAADHELPNCNRTRQTIQKYCDQLGYQMEVIHVAKVGSVAKRQHRICVDFRVIY